MTRYEIINNILTKINSKGLLPGFGVWNLEYFVFFLPRGKQNRCLERDTGGIDGENAHNQKKYITIVSESDFNSHIFLQ